MDRTFKTGPDVFQVVSGGKFTDVYLLKISRLLPPTPKQLEDLRFPPTGHNALKL